jgi:hypothetical protein
MLFAITKELFITVKRNSCALYTVEPGYNDIILYDISSITSDILW